MSKSMLYKKIPILFTMIFVGLSVMWMMSSSNSLIYDDYSTILNAKFNTYKDLFKYFPTSDYNDRPIGLIFIKVLNTLFELNYLMYHLCFVLIHIFNVFLIYKIGLRILHGSNNSEYFAALAAAIFGINPISTMAVSWISAVYDLLCCFLALLSLLFYLKMRDDDKYISMYGILSVLFYYISIRTKEMSIILPIIILLYELTVVLNNKLKFRFTWTLIAQMFIMLSYTVILFTLHQERTTDSPYYQSFNPSILIKNTIRYILLYFDMENSSFTYSKFSVSSLIGIILIFLVFAYSIYLIVYKKNFSLFMSFLVCGISLSLVLPMVNMQHRLYLYIPSVFFGYTITLFLYQLHKYKSIKYICEIIILIIPCIYLIMYTPGMIKYREYWLNMCKEEQKAFNQISKLERPITDSNIYIKGASEGYNIFYYGPGNSIKLLFEDISYKVTLVNEFPNNPSKPYVFLEYNEGNINEIKRDETGSNLVITSVYPSNDVIYQSKFNDSGTLNIGIVCNIINDKLKIYINNKKFNTTIGNDFISATITKNDIVDNLIRIYVKDEENGLNSQTISIKIIE